MSAADNGGPAFPVTGQNSANYGDCGMTLRDYFAAKAMHQMLNGAVLPTKEDRDKYLPMVASIAYEIADAMLTERAK